jgi:hypothetical protein
MTLKAARGWAEGTAVAGGDPVARGDPVAGGDPAVGGGAEHPGSTATHPDSTATTHRDAAEMIDSFAGIRWERRTA